MALGRTEETKALFGNFEKAFVDNGLSIGSELGASGTLLLEVDWAALGLIGGGQGSTTALRRIRRSMSLIMATLRGAGLEAGNGCGRAGCAALGRSGWGSGGGPRGVGLRRIRAITGGPISTLR